MSLQAIRETGLISKLYSATKMARQIENGLAAFRLPGLANPIKFVAGNTRLIPTDYLPSESGFIIAPFDGNSLHSFFIEGEEKNLNDLPNCIDESYNLDFYTRDIAGVPIQEKTKKDYDSLVCEAIQYIKEGKAQKIVTSRQAFFKIPEDFDPIPVFFRLVQAYPDAFVCLSSTPYTGTWICASPEILVSKNDLGIFETVALAGTQPALDGVDQKDIFWTQKEIEEQALVSRYIINCFKQIRLREFTEKGPFTIKAGNLMHLKTIFQVDTDKIGYRNLLETMLRLLHPTSAVCGMPHEAAQNFLARYEAYSRDLYSGYLGPVAQSDSTHLFVNLRCMEILKTHLRLFAGGGITTDSDVEKEWKETEYKIQTLSAFIH